MAVVADTLVAKLVDTLVSTISDEIMRLAGVEEEVEKLTSSLQSIQAVLADAERKQWKDKTVQVWLDRLKSVAYDIDDALDAWRYEILSSQTEREEIADKPASQRKCMEVWPFNLLSACYCCSKAVSRHYMAVKISDLNARLDVIAAEKDKYNFQSLGSHVEPKDLRNLTTSVIDISKVTGRDAEKENLVSMLLSGNSERKSLRVISISGMGGIGKTTLAKLVYNNERVKSHFHKRIWVCVSDPFDVTRIAKEILESLLGTKPDLDGLPQILARIQELVGEDECLFVLDDVWNEDREKWEQLKDCLKGSASKSSILVTSRKEEVGRIMGCLKSDIVRVGKLSDGASWELFCMIAFHGRSDGEMASLEMIGREVVERCKGLPLAIKAIASLLQLKESLREWQSVFDSELWNREEFQRDIEPALRLSYDDLPSPLKQCFTYCSIYPKDCKIQRDELIRHWIAQGFINGTQSQDTVMVGEEYFKHLVMRSFFQDVEVARGFYEQIETRCKMHDIVHDFAQSLVTKECLCIEVDDMNEDNNFSNDLLAHSLRHLSIIFQDEIKCVDSFYNLKQLHSLVVSPSSVWLPEPSSCGFDLQKLFSEFTLLRSLVLSHCGIEEIPFNLNKLIHLRELDLSFNLKLKDLPDTIWELYNLQMLDLRGTRIISVKGIGRLTNLMYLGNNYTEIVLPKELVRSSGLMRLNEIKIDANDEEALSLKDLKNFNQLGGELSIQWLRRDDRDAEDAKQAQLRNNKNITGLQLDFGSREEEEEVEEDEEKE